uniref:Reticulophagy regulator 1 n=1 Tax=Lepisosteus oculatus TaxID=7918 RepID=W5N4J1_LEPOC|nr:PREDICTED: reticulophagy receptor FAM134B [Lepisosteus oculatus]
MASLGRGSGEDAEAGGQDGKASTESLRITEAGEMADAEMKEQVAAPRQPRDSSLFSHFVDVVTWRRPLSSTLLFAATNAVFWFVALSSWRVCYLLALSLVCLVTVQMVKDLVLSRTRGAQLWRRLSESWEVIDPKQESRPEAGQLTECWMSYSLFLQEMSSFKQQNPGKFCLLICGLCTFLAVLGRYIPGVVISYFIVLCVFLWPLLSSHEFGQWIEPVLQKLDFGVGGFLQKMKENHEKRNAKRGEENSEAELSALFPKLDSSTMCKELSISDTEASEVSWTDNGTFNLSEGHTPQTETSDDLDRPSDHEEAFAGGLSEFPSVDNGTNGDDEDLSIGLPTPSFGQTEGDRPSAGERALDLVNRMAGDVIAAAVTAAVREQLGAPSWSAAPPALDFGGETDSEDGEDFELLDQSELEQLQSELGLAQEAQEAEQKSSKPSGFLSNLLGRH